MPLAEIVAALSWKPAAIARVADRHGRPVAPGEPANVTVFDPERRMDSGPRPLASKPRNTPYAGRSCPEKSTTPSSTEPPTVRNGTPSEMSMNTLQCITMQNRVECSQAVTVTSPRACRARVVATASEASLGAFEPGGSRMIHDGATSAG